MRNLQFSIVSLCLGFVFCALAISAHADPATCAKTFLACQETCNNKPAQPKETLKSCNSQLSTCLGQCMNTFKKCK